MNNSKSLNKSELDLLLSKKTYIKIKLRHPLISVLEREKKNLIDILKEKKHLLDKAKEKQMLKIKILRNLDNLKKQLYLLYNLLLYTNDNDPSIIIQKEKRKKFIEKMNDEFIVKDSLENIKEELKKENFDEIVEKKTEIKNSEVEKEEEILRALEKELENLEKELKELGV